MADPLASINLQKALQILYHTTYGSVEGRLAWITVERHIEELNDKIKVLELGNVV